MMRLITLGLAMAAAIITSQAQLSTRENAATNYTQNEVKDITPAQLERMLGTPGLFIYDCNEADMYEFAHVPGSMLTVYDAVSAADLPADHNATLVFYCYSPECPAGATAANTAAKLGYKNVYSMSAGIVGWQDAGLKTEP